MTTTIKTIEIDPKLLKTIHRMAMEKETTEEKIINDFVLKGIEKNETTEEKIKRLRVNDQLLRVNPNPIDKNKHMGDLIGVLKNEPFDTIEAIKEARERKFNL